MDSRSSSNQSNSDEPEVVIGVANPPQPQKDSNEAGSMNIAIQEPEAEFVFNREVHPLLLPNVISFLLKNLSSLELKVARSVCATWNEEANKLIRLERTVLLDGDNKLIDYMACVTPPAASQLHSRYHFTKSELSSKILEQFFCSYGMNMKSIGFEHTRIIEEHLYGLLEAHSPKVETLQLRNTPVSQYAAPGRNVAGPSVQASTSTALPQLTGLPFHSIRKVVIGDCKSFRMETRHPQAHPPLSLEEKRVNMVKLLKRLPNLQTLGVSQLEGTTTLHEFSLYLLRCLIETGPEILKNLTLLDFPLNIVEQDLLTGLASLKLTKLSSLDINLEVWVEDKQLTDVIIMVAENLIQLSLAFAQAQPCSYNFMGIPPAFYRLRDLTLKRYKWSLGFLDRLHALKTLTLVDLNVFHILPNRRGPLHAGLEAFKVITGDGDEKEGQLLNNPGTMMRIIRAFPNIKVLHVPGVGDAGLNTIYMDMPLLEELHVLNGTFTDAGITGLRLDFCNDLLETFAFRGLDADAFRCSLYLGNLTNLRNLWLQSDMMSNLSVMFGVLQCHRLTQVTLKSPMIDDVAMEAFVLAINRTMKVDVTGCPGLSDFGKMMAESLAPAPQRPKVREPTSNPFPSWPRSRRNYPRDLPALMVEILKEFASKPYLGNAVKDILEMLTVHSEYMTAERIEQLRKYMREVTKMDK